jgi:cell division protease FtsH
MYMKLAYFLSFIPLCNAFNGLVQRDNYNNIIKTIIDHKVDRLIINTNHREIISVDNLPVDDNLFSHYHIAEIDPILLPNLIEKTSNAGVPISFTSSIFDNIINSIAMITGFILPIYILYLVGSFIVNGPMSPQTGLPFGIPKKSIEYIKPNVTLDNWAGSPEVIDECIEVISYIENKDKYENIGATMPRGILLEGPPGTGKTLLAKAIASATNSTFIPVAASEFVELFVGMGAARVRELFLTAREKRPSIIFIDEIDAVGRQRGAGANQANDEREQTLNQLLYEMDGFQNNTDIIIIAATNRKDVLDQALLRPGRFDRLISVPLPDRTSREKILDYYLSKSKLERPFDVTSISELTDGFSGAQLKNLINEAAIFSVRNNYTKIQERFVFDAFEKLLVGIIKKGSNTLPATNERVAIHETGHALLAMYFHQYFTFQKVSIQPTYSGAGGYTIFSEKPEIKDGGLYTKDVLKKRLIIMLGGKAAESIYYGNDFVSVGAVQDLNQANRLAKRMICNFGMGENLEVFYKEDILGMDDSQYTKSMVDKEALDLLNEAYKEAKRILLDNKEKVIEFSKLLQEEIVITAPVSVL